MCLSRKLPCLLVFCAMMAGVAHGRAPDGTLSLIRTPNNGMPVLGCPGDGFEIVLEEEARQLEIVRDGQSYPLAAVWRALPGGLAAGRVTLDAAVAPGTYALRAATAGREDVNHRSVYVYERFPDAYGIAHMTDTHIGSGCHPRSSDAIVKEVIHAVNATEAALVLVTGDLTENGDSDQFRLLLEVLDTCTLPTFVVPGNHDRQANHYEAFFGTLVYRFTFGRDGFLGFDTKDFLVADDMGKQDGLLHRFRRELMPKRWSIGFTHRYEPMMGMRAQLALFVDDPLDCLLYGHYHREAGEGDGIPWGRTAFIMTPAAINGFWRLVHVDHQGIHPQPAEKSAEIR